MLQTKNFGYEGLRQQGMQFEKLLAACQQELGDRSEDVPRVLLDYAATVCEGFSPALNAGPADATVPSNTDSEVTRETDGEEAASIVTPSYKPGVEERTPIELWNIAI